MTNRSAFAAVAAALACILHAAPASALLARAFVSGTGSDVSTCGGRVLPCRTFQYAHDAIVSAGGEIAVLDGADYGPLAIAKSLSVVHEGAGPAASGGVTINAGAADVVFLRGLLVENLGSTAEGLTFNSGASLTVSNCVFRNFVQDGIFINAAADVSVYILDTRLERNGQSGVTIFGSGAVNGTISGVTANANGSGLVALTPSPSKLTLTNSVLTKNDVHGAVILDNVAVLATDTNASNNGYAGFYVAGSGSLSVARSVAASNNAYGVGVIVPGLARSYGDNRIDNNRQGAVLGTLDPVAKK